MYVASMINLDALASPIINFVREYKPCFLYFTCGKSFLFYLTLSTDYRNNHWENCLTFQSQNISIF